jgi:site-specific DNA-methyltransferase (adenine-specific)
MSVEMTTESKPTAERTAPPAVVLQRFVRGHNHVTLYNADCRDILPEIVADYIITDPPYGISYDASHKKYQNGKHHGSAEWDKEPYDPTPILEMSLPSIIWGGNCFASKLPDNPGWLCWVKINRNGTKIRQAEMELAWSNCVTRSQSYRYSWIGAGMEGETNRVNGGTCHPTQKPVPLMAWCMETIGVPKDATVLDPYIGSGTTAIACLRTGRNCIGIERDAEHFKTACARLEAECNQGALL